MPELIDAGFVYIAKPHTGSRTAREVYVEKESELEELLLMRDRIEQYEISDSLGKSRKLRAKLAAVQPAPEGI